jgi:DNA-directed RNA polymerase subunit RPC12/RpoP
MQVTADVKCYYCGHVSGQIVGEREHPERGRFEPRPGFKGELPVPGQRIRCERCSGPVYLEDASPIELPFIRRRPHRARPVARPNLSGAA